jgi:hypothetical protein
MLGRWAEPLSTNLPWENPNLIGLGWTTNSPLFTARLARIGIDDVYTSLESDPHVYLVGFEKDAARIAEYYRQHRGIQLRFVPRVRGLPLFYGSIVGAFNVWSVALVGAP